MRRADSIAAEIERGIVAGEIADGSRLDEAALAARFGVSRTPVREALQSLLAGGLVRHEPRRGVFVQQPGARALLEMFEVMAELEAFVGRLAAGRIRPGALDALGEANDACAKAAEAGDADRYYDANAVFHRTIYAEAGNAFLEGEALRLQARLAPWRRAQLSLRGRMAESLAEHLEITRHLAAGDGARAASALRGHVAVQGEKFHHLLRTLPAA